MLTSKKRLSGLEQLCRQQILRTATWGSVVCLQKDFLEVISYCQWWVFFLCLYCWGHLTQKPFPFPSKPRRNWKIFVLQISWKRILHIVKMNYDNFLLFLIVNNVFRRTQNKNRKLFLPMDYRGHTCHLRCSVEARVVVRWIQKYFVISSIIP